MIEDDGHPKSTGRTFVLLAVSLAIIGVCLVAVHSGDGCEATEAPSPVVLQPSPGLVADAAPSCPDCPLFVIDGVVYKAFGDGVAEVLGFAGYPATDLVIPPMVTPSDGGEYRVVRIADDAFRDLAVLESAFIPDTVTKIGRNAFGGCVSLTALTVPVTAECHHGDDGYAFKDVLLEGLTLTRGFDGPRNEGNEFWNPMVSMLRDLVVDDGVTVFTTSFRGSMHLKSVTLKDVQSIREDQFRECRSLLTVAAPKARTVDDNAFMDCPRLNTVDLSSLESLARGAFVHCQSLRTVVSDKLLIDGGQMFMILDDDSASLIQQIDADPVLIEIPAEVTSPSGRNYTVTEVGMEAFREQENLRLLVIGDDVRRVGEHAFQDCRSLDVIAIPIGTDCSYDTGKSAFEGVKPTKLVLSSEGYDPEGYMDNEFWRPFVGSLRGLVVAEGITDFKTSFKGGKLVSLIMESVKTVHDGQFEGCDDLAIASFPGAVTVGRSAFKGCDKLMAVDMSEAKDIGREAFSGCYVLGEFFGDSVETVGERGFYGCVPLAEFNFDSIRKVGSKAFHDTAVMNAPSSKSHCFAKDSFGSTLDNAAKIVVKKKWASITSSLATMCGIVSLTAVFETITLRKEMSEVFAEMNEVIEQRNGMFREDLNGDLNLYYNYRELSKRSNTWKWVAIGTAIAAVALGGLSVYLWNKET